MQISVRIVFTPNVYGEWHLQVLRSEKRESDCRPLRWQIWFTPLSSHSLPLPKETWGSSWGRPGQHQPLRLHLGFMVDVLELDVHKHPNSKVATGETAMVALVAPMYLLVMSQGLRRRWGRRGNWRGRRWKRRWGCGEERSAGTGGWGGLGIGEMLCGGTFEVIVAADAKRTRWSCIQGKREFQRRKLSTLICWSQAMLYTTMWIKIEWVHNFACKRREFTTLKIMPIAKTHGRK